ncbi:hypothetical protein [Spirosoma aerolatum]|uniref:hypothetical protein n=1 Tax=Spirosoma aerolatum TaxID=1211326 RepID=UPI0009ADA8B4|nr:hypothetical protein [Spirosoma aerolatum]
MSIQEMRSKLHQLIDEEQNETILAEVSRILSGESETDILEDLTDDQLAGLEKAREEIQNGNYISLAEHKQKIEQWLAARR